MEESDFRMVEGRSAAGAEVPATVRTEASPETSDGPSQRTHQVVTTNVAEVDKDTLCPICMQTITHAFLTACGHSFCYICIFTHLRRKRDCPCCGHYLTDNHIFPNLLLDKFIRKISAGEVARTAPLVELFRQALQQGCEIPIKELDGLLSVLAEKKRKIEQREEESNMQILRDFLQCLRNLKLDELNEIQTDLQCIKEDINAVETHRTKLYKAKERCSIKPMMLDALTAASPCPLLLDKHNHGVSSNTRYLEGGSAKTVNENADSTSHASSHGLITASKRRLHSQFSDLKECYLQKRRHGNGRLNNQEKEEICTTTNEGYSPALGDFQSILTAFTQYSRLRVVAELRHGDLFHSANIVSSIEFDRDDELFATAGVSRRIKIFEFSSVVNEPTDVHYPIVEMPTRTKLSCLSWNKFTKTHIASCDYEGIVTVWDVATSQSMMEYEEHEKRAWSLDFSCSEPSMLVSGSDDCKVKVWCTRQEASALSIDMKANICSVKYNPESSIYLAVGSADHHIHYYDLRNISQPLHVFKGHKKAVSYVKFLSNNELASASTDCTLRLWDVKENVPLRTFRGHTNEKNFVGLSVNSDYLACGSETNEVFAYHKAISKPAAWHGFGSDANNADDNGATYFTSAVCWKNDSPTMLAANSQGTIKVLVLAA